MKEKRTHYTLLLVAEKPVEEEKLLEALKPFGEPSLKNYSVHTVKEPKEATA